MVLLYLSVSLIENGQRLSIALVDVRKAFIDLFLARSQVAVQEQKGCVLIVELDGSRAFVSCQSTGASFNFARLHFFDVVNLSSFCKHKSETAKHNFP